MRASIFSTPILIVALLLLVACQTPAGSPPTETAVSTGSGQAASPAPPTATPPPPTSEPAAQPTEPPQATPTAQQQPIFNTPFEDRTPFSAGLKPSEQAILNDLPLASVYQMKLELDESLSLINGRFALQYHNAETEPLNDLYFHLFPNLLGGNLSINNLMLNGDVQTPLLEGANNSLLRLPLPTPLQPQESALVTLDFQTTAPLEPGRNYGIFAFTENILALAHFYPQAAVFDDEGWNIDTPSPQGDVVYADSSFYLVEVSAPREVVMAASGVEILREETAVSQTVTYAAGPMRDFYLAASPDYVVTSQTVNGITLNSYAPARYAQSAANTLRYTADSIALFEQLVGPYPFTELDIVSTPTLALGVEYPGIIANAIRIYENDSRSQQLLESTTVHEVAHQWFYSLIGNDQLDEPWLDESVTQYVTYRYYQELYGEQGAQGFLQSLNGRWQSVGQAAIPIGQPVSAYSGAEYGAIIYGRGPIFVDVLAQTVGEAVFEEFLNAYYKQTRYGVATTEQFRTLLESTCGCTLTSQFNTWIYTAE